MKEIGSVLAASGTWMDGEDSYQRGKYLASRSKQYASEVRGASQRDAAEIRRQKRLMLSAARAKVAAGGGDTTDVSIQDALADTERVGEYRALSALYNGSQRAQQAIEQGKAAKNQGKAARLSSAIGGAATLFSGLYDARNVDEYGRKKRGVL